MCPPPPPEGKTNIEAARIACCTRFRPVLMTALAHDCRHDPDGPGPGPGRRGRAKCSSWKGGDLRLSHGYLNHFVFCASHVFLFTQKAQSLYQHDT